MLAKSRKQLFQSIDNRIQKSISAIESESIVLSRNLREMAQDREDGKPLWSEGGFSSLKAYCEDRAIGKSRFKQLMAAGEIVARIESEDRQNGYHMVTPVNERQLRPLAKLVSQNPESIPQVWDYAIEVASEEDCDQPENRHVQAAMREYNAKAGDLQSTRRKYSNRERDLKADCENGWTVVANINTDSALISWAEAKGIYIYVGRGSKWGNPYQIPQDGDRDRVCWCYEQHYIKFKPSIIDNIESLEGKVLGCYCSPQRCHGDELAKRANKEDA